MEILLVLERCLFLPIFWMENLLLIDDLGQEELVRKIRM